MQFQGLKKYEHKIKSVDALQSIIGDFANREKKVVMCHGTFDIVHPGHIRHLLYAKTKGDILLASLTSDTHISKANMRPYVPETLRALNLAAFEMVDYVIVDNNPKPLDSIRKLKPNVFCKGYEYFKDNKLPPHTLEEKHIVESYGGNMIFTPGDIVYSSSHLIETNRPNLAIDKLMLLMEAENLTINDLQSTLAKFSGLKVHVVGDTIVDSLTKCTMIGGMTKTPTMSVRYEDRDDYTGGAAIVAKHLRAAGAEVTFTTLLGDDKWKKVILDDLEGSDIKVNAIIDKSKPTVNKNAIVVNNYRLLKIDTLDNSCISNDVLMQFITSIQNTRSDVVIFSDFRHGVFSKNTVGLLINAIPNNVLKVADSQVASRWGNILEFQNFDLITPNEREVRFALGDQDTVIRPLGSELYQKANCNTMILKMGKRGAMVFRNNNTNDSRSFFTLDSFCKNVVDPVGAGDALLAYSSLALAINNCPVISSILGSFAAAIECSKDGNISVQRTDVLAEIKKIAADMVYSEELPVN